MKLTNLLLVLSVGLIYASISYAQTTLLTMDMSSAPVAQILDAIEEQTDFHFFYNNKLINMKRETSVEAKNKDVFSVLDQLFDGSNVRYRVIDKDIILTVNESKASAQETRRVTGKVTDQKGEPVIGANIVVTGTTVGTITDFDGQFQIDAPISATSLEVRYIGYIAERVSIRDRNTVSVVLKEDLHQLEDVVIIGYGVQKKENLTGAVDAIKGEKLANRTSANVSQSLQGMSPGMTVINAGGEPGADAAQIKIRGIGTFNNSNPLILVDGVMVSNLDNVNPQDIENISILKDAASSAIYGARAANGVLLITTKRGAATDGMTIKYNGYVGFQSLARAPEWVAADDYMRLVNESLANANREPKYSEEAIAATMAGTDPYKYPNTDWWKLLFRTGLQHKHNLSINGGTERLKTAVSINYLHQEGIMINTDFEQYGVRVNNDLKLHQKLDAGLDVSVNVREREIPARIGDVYWNLLHDVPPTIAARNPDGTYPLGPTNRNPLSAANESGYDKYNNYQVIASPFIRYKVFKDFTINARMSLKENFDLRKRYYNYYQFKDYDTKQTTLTWNSSLQERNEHNHYVNWQATADYDKIFGQHFIHALVGYSQEYNSWKQTGGERRDFYSNDLQELDRGSDEGKNSFGYSNEWTLRSVFGRINYAYNDRYLLEANFRYDGSSRFAKGRRFGFFPSFSGAWRISEEGFMKENETFSNLKLRASYGKLGNQEIDLYQYIHTITLGQNYTFNGQLVSGAAQTALANELISWETTTSFDVGFDLGLWKNKLTVTADYFIRNTDDILLRRDIPATVGLSAPVQNVGAVKNTGWELAFNYQDKIGDFNYNVIATISDVKNEIKKFGENSTWDWYINKEGESINSLYGYVTEGLFKTQSEVDNHAYQHSMTAPGDIIYKDMNNDHIINSDDKVVLGSTIPRYSYTLTLSGRYKGFDLNLFFNGIGKCNGYQIGALIEGPIWDGFTTKEMLDRWTPQNTNATWPRLVYNTIHNQEASDYWIQNTSYFRLKNAQLGYSLPKSILDKININNIRFYVSGENMFTLTKAKNLDPEFPSGRSNYYPQTKIISFGVDVTF
ncbi:MAG: TonB-dependent receptor [Tannerellaceae bacterium]|nr:TonB-dependent receptor [Tannerellaceae bacterium]